MPLTVEIWWGVILYLNIRIDGMTEREVSSERVSALPPVDGLEVVAWKVSATDRLDQFFEIEGEADQWANSPGVFDSVVSGLVTLSQASSVIAGLRAERDHWKANHDQMVQRNSVLRERPDLPVDRLPAISRYEARISSLEEENKRLREALDPFADVAEKDIGDSEHENDLFQPMQQHNRAPRLTVGHLRAAHQALEDHNG